VQRLAVAAYLARLKGESRIHTESDLRGYLVWCEQRGLDPLTVSLPHVELYIRWLQEVRGAIDDRTTGPILAPGWTGTAPPVDSAPRRPGRRQTAPDASAPAQAHLRHHGA
jgi:hypothetical protein